jgi:hypothetical protein
VKNADFSANDPMARNYVHEKGQKNEILSPETGNPFEMGIWRGISSVNRDCRNQCLSDVIDERKSGQDRQYQDHAIGILL